MKFELTPCEDSDLNELWEKGFETDPAEDNTIPELFVFKVTSDEGSIIGGCVLDIDAMKTAEFDRLWVDEHYRRRGIGSALIRAAEQKALEKGCHMILNSYTFDFQTARSLFERHGYRLIGTVKDWPRGYENYILIKSLECDSEENSVENTHVYAEYEIRAGSEEDGEIIAERLEMFNCSFAPRSHAYIDMNKKITDDKGRMIAGCIAGISGWNTLHIDAFWMDEPFRNSDVGSCLLYETEREAKEKGAYLSSTGGTDEQAVFFKNHGYIVTAVIDDKPTWYMMHKHF